MLNLDGWLLLVGGAAVFAAVSVLHVAALLLTGAGARVMRLGRERSIGVLFGGTQKSLYVGVWIAAAWYPDLDAALVDWDEIDSMLREAYRLKAPKTLAKQLDANP